MEELKKLPLETRLKLIQVAEDVLVRDGWERGGLHMVEMTGGVEGNSVWRSVYDVQRSMLCGMRLTNNSEVRHCALGAIEQAAFEQGELPSIDYSDPSQSYANVSTLMGWTDDDEQKVWTSNDREQRSRGREALKVAEELVHRENKGRQSS